MKYLVIGDIMIDRYVMGSTERISPEAPVPIIDVKMQYDVLGGAANCASNIISLQDPGDVDIIGYIGDDNDGEIALDLLNKEGINFRGWTTKVKPTIVKERVFCNGQQMFRMDIEDKTELPFDRPLFQTIDFDRYDYIIVSDYAKGVVSRRLMQYLAPYNFKIIIDPKPENWGCYNPGVLLITPNEFEFNQRTPELPPPQHMLVTKGKCGMTLYTNFPAGSGYVDIQGEEVENCEVIGAGDTVVAVIAVTLAMTGYEMVDCCRIANECAKYVVSQPGTATVPKEVWEAILAQYAQTVVIGEVS